MLALLDRVMMVDLVALNLPLMEVVVEAEHQKLEKLAQVVEQVMEEMVYLHQSQVPLL